MAHGSQRHALEDEYQLDSLDLLEAISKRFRLKVALEGAVAEEHLGKRLERLVDRGVIASFVEHDEDGMHDFTMTLSSGEEIKVECKNVRNSTEGYRKGGEIIAFKVETQKTRTSQGDPSSRFYDVDSFDIIAVCLGKKTEDWAEFMFIRTTRLKTHSKYLHKLAAMQRVPLPTDEGIIDGPWYHSLEELLADEEK